MSKLGHLSAGGIACNTHLIESLSNDLKVGLFHLLLHISHDQRWKARVASKRAKTGIQLQIW